MARTLEAPVLLNDAPARAVQVPANARLSSKWANFTVFAAFLAITILLQLLSGAYKAELSAYPDEPAHYTTSLMVREYVLHPKLTSPIGFAEEYYRHYPKVAFGHWPPVLYIVQGLWMLLFTCSPISIRLEIAFTTAMLAFLVWREASDWFPGVKWAPRLCGLFLLAVPLVQSSTAEEMAEPLLTLFCFLGAIYFGRYLDSQKRRDALWFGLYVTLAVLTKGSGWLLLLMAGIALLLTRKFQLLRNKSLWLAAGLVALLCLPWQIVTLQSAARGWTGGTKPSFAYTMDALVNFCGITVQIIGSILFAVVLVGIFVTVVRPLFRGHVAPRPAVFFALLTADYIFHSIVPAGVEDRKMILAVPALIFFLAHGCLWFAERFAEKFGDLQRSRVLITSLAGLTFMTQTFAIPVVKHSGYREAAAFLAPEERSGRTILVCSESGGEGLLISEIAMRDPWPNGVVLRATKELAQVDWNGDRYHALLHSEAELMHYLEQRKVDMLVVDTYPPIVPFAHHQLMLGAIRDYPAAFQLERQFSDSTSYPNGEISVYKFLHAAKLRP